MVELQKVNFIGEIPLKDKPGGEIIGSAKVEVTKSGYVIAHVDMQKIPEAMKTGFSFGSFSIAEPPPCEPFEL